MPAMARHLRPLDASSYSAAGRPPLSGRGRGHSPSRHSTATVRALRVGIDVLGSRSVISRAPALASRRASAMIRPRDGSSPPPACIGHTQNVAEPTGRSPSCTVRNSLTGAADASGRYSNLGSGRKRCRGPASPKRGSARATISGSTLIVRRSRRRCRHMARASRISAPSAWSTQPATATISGRPASPVHEFHQTILGSSPVL